MALFGLMLGRLGAALGVGSVNSGTGPSYTPTYYIYGF